MRIWDICCGTKSVSNVWKEHGHEALTLDIDPKCMPDICTDIMSGEYTYFGLEPPDFIWCSPPCTHYSIARTTAKTPRDLEGSDKIVQRCLDIIAYWRPRYWVIENPQTGLLKSREVYEDCPSWMLTIVLLEHRIASAHVSGPTARGHPATNASMVATATPSKSAMGRAAH